jgi:hypothetical protein
MSYDRRPSLSGWWQDIEHAGIIGATPSDRGRPASAWPLWREVIMLHPSLPATGPTAGGVDGVIDSHRAAGVDAAALKLELALATFQRYRRPR